MLLRILAKSLDYFWFYSALFAISELFFDHVYFLLITLLCLPLCFVPIETILIKLFRTTVGKALFGIYYKNSFTWKGAFFLSFRKSIYIQALFIPLLNALFALYFLFENQNGKKQRWNKEPFITKFPKAYIYLPLLLIALLSSLIVATPEFVYNQASKVIPLEKLIQRPFNSFSDPADWVKIESAEKPFTVCFPKEPKIESSSHKASGTTLIFQEYVAEGDTTFSLGVLELPRKWTKWGSGLVLKGAIKVLEGKGRIGQKKKTTYNGFPCYEYRMTRNNQSIIGIVFLVDQTLYTLELRQQEPIAPENVAIAEKFFHSFRPSVALPEPIPAAEVLPILDNK